MAHRSGQEYVMFRLRMRAQSLQSSPRSARARGSRVLVLVLTIDGGGDSTRPRPPSTEVPGQPAIAFISPRNGAVQRGTGGRRQGRRRKLRARPAPLRRRTAARRGQHPLQPQPRARLRRPGQAAESDRTARSATDAWSAPPSTTPTTPAPTGSSATGSAPPAATRRRPGRRSSTATCGPASTGWSSTLATQRRLDHALPRRHQLPDPREAGPRHRRAAPAARSPAPRPRPLAARRLTPGANTSLCIVRCDADLPPFDGLPAPLPPPALGLAGLRLAGDRDDGADPAADRPAPSTRSRTATSPTCCRWRWRSSAPASSASA